MKTYGADIAGSFAGLLVLSPILVFSRQRRYGSKIVNPPSSWGRGSRAEAVSFRMVKFRSMR